MVVSVVKRSVGTKEKVLGLELKWLKGSKSLGRKPGDIWQCKGNISHSGCGPEVLSGECDKH